MRVMLTLTTEGQVTFPKAVLQHLRAGPGDRLAIELLPGGKVEVRTAPREGMKAFIGCLRSPLFRPPTIDEMNDAISDGWAGGR